MLEFLLLGWLLLLLEAVDPMRSGTPLKDTGQWCGEEVLGVTAQPLFQLNLSLLPDPSIRKQASSKSECSSSELPRSLPYFLCSLSKPELKQALAPLCCLCQAFCHSNKKSTP